MPAMLLCHIGVMASVHTLATHLKKGDRVVAMGSGAIYRNVQACCLVDTGAPCFPWWLATLAAFGFCRAQMKSHYPTAGGATRKPACETKYARAWPWNYNTKTRICAATKLQPGPCYAIPVPRAAEHDCVLACACTCRRAPHTAVCPTS